MLIVRKYDSKRKVIEEGGGGGGIFDQLKLGLAMIPLRLGFDTYNKIMKHGESGNLVHKMYSSKTGEHKRLDFVCTKPEYQGLGLSSTLIKRVCSDADAEGWNLYLSTSDRRNQEFYLRFGFKWVGECEGEGGFITAGMSRRPKGEYDGGVEMVGKVALEKKGDDVFSWIFSVGVIMVIIYMSNFK
ncbi:hypothetical protein TrVE_jg7033 [Triparma verrucosa]|nr:hypothetical protein TrVE_jg7033 [Triparma verrucosa]